MDTCQIGELIREYREEQGLTREALAGDFCAVSTLARIESGEELPGKLLANELCSELGLVAPDFQDGILTEADVIRCQIERKIEEKLFCKDYEYIPLLKKYSECGDMDALEQQYYDYHMALAKRAQGESNGNLQDLFEKSISLTLKSCTKDFLPLRPRLTNMELLLLRQIALCQYTVGNKKENALEIIKFITDYYETKPVIDKLISSEFPFAMQNFTEWLFAAGYTEEALIVCTRGLKVCDLYSELIPFLKILEIKAKCHRILKNQADYEKTKLLCAALKEISNPDIN